MLLTKVNVAKTGRSFDDDDGSLLLVDVVPLPVVVELKMERSRVWEENIVVVLVSGGWCVSFFVLFFRSFQKQFFDFQFLRQKGVVARSMQLFLRSHKDDYSPGNRARRREQNHDS